MRSVTRCVARDPEQWKVDSPKAWSMVFAAFLIFFAPFGLAHSFSIFIVSLTNDFHVTRADIALVITINMTLSALAGVISGPLTDRYGPKRVMCLGLVIWLVGSLITTYAETFALVYFTQGILAGVGGGFLAPPVMAVVPMWFDKYRSTAVGFAVLGSGLGNVLFALLGQELLRQLGWREAQRVMVLVAGGMICIAIILIDRRTAPEQHTGGLFHMAKRLVRVPAYRYFLLTGFFFQWGFYIPYIHLLPSMNDLGLGGDAQGLALAMIGAGSSVGRITMGPIADAAGRIGTFRFALFSTGITLAMWSICFTPEEFYVFGFFYGFTSGSFIALAPAAAGELWGVNNLGGITALFNVVALPGSLASGPLAGVIYLHTGSYLGAIGMGSCCILISAVSLFGVRHSNNVNWIEDNNGKDVTTATVVRVEDLD